MTPPRAVIFDMDGTLVDTVDLHARAWVETLHGFGVAADLDDIRRMIGKGGDQLLPGLVPPDLLSEQGEEIESARADLFRTAYRPRVRPFPGVRPLLERLRADGLAVALASSGQEADVAFYKDLLDIGHLLDAETTSEDADRSKPFPDIFAAALRRLGLRDPSQAMVVGDTPYDAEAARGAGIPMLGVLCGGFPEAVLRAAGAVAVYHDPAHLLRDYADSPLAQGAR